jgi:hypothetical protein
VKIEGTGTKYNDVWRNYIGTDKEGKEALPNEIGVHISSGATQNTIGGGMDEWQGNIISGNTGSGVKIEGIGTKENKVRGNHIGTDKNGKEALPNHEGLRIENGASKNKLEKNIISGNNENGVFITGEGTLDNRIQENYIGTDIGMTEDLGNKKNGICIANLDIQESRTRVYGNRIYWNKENGIGIWNSNENDIFSNTIWYNCRGIKMVYSHTYGGGNSIKYNRCTSTGIHLDHSSGEFIGNTIEGDEGDAIRCENGSNPTINWNNIYNNTGYGLNNLDPSVTINAQNNWWGGPSGPGGAGPGTGDEVSGNVDFHNWLEKSVLLVVTAGEDICSMPGKTDSVWFSIRNWAETAETFDVSVADSLGWALNPTFLVVNLDAQGDTTLAIGVSMPSDTPQGTVNKVTLTATSQSDPSVMDSDALLVTAVTPAPAHIAVLPSSVLLNPGQTQLFTAQEWDGLGNRVEFDPVWSATGGTITQAGLYTAGDRAGTYIVSAENPETQLQGQAEVRIILPGDFNADGRVWTDDFVMFVTQFGRQQGEEGFDPIYDLDGDGRVWTGDFSIFVAQFGKTSGTAKRVAGLPPVGKNQNAEISVSVQTKVTSLSSEAREFTVELSVENATELRGYGLTLDYDSQSLEFLGATPGKNNLLNKAGGSTPLFLVVSNPDRPGQVWIANALADSKPAEGNGLLASLSFRTRGRLSGSSLPISLSMLELFDAQLRLNSVSGENLTKQIRLVPGQNRLAQNYPNPFNAVTCINYQLAQPAFTTIKVYNLSGQLVRTLVKEKKPAGWYSARWDGRDNSGRAVASGIYFYHLSAGGFLQVRKMLLLK